jgi:glycosyltransferase involved in cell wall biosynthesis
VPSGDRLASPTQGVLRVALYSGIVFRHDAVSTSFLHKLQLLTRLRDAGFPVEVTGFTHASDFDHPDIRVVTGLADLLRTAEFGAADVHVFECGMWYELVNALFLIDRPSLVIDHNTTPVEFISDPKVQLACERSRHERHNLTLATHVATVGEFTRGELLGMGFPTEHVSTLHLPAATSTPIGSSTGTGRRPGDPVRLLYVGRFVRAKGVLELLDAMENLWAEDMVDVTLTMAGSVRFPDTEVLAAVEQACAAHRRDGLLTLHVDAPDEQIAELYAGADALVMPSHHEGFCVPVIEAMASGCYVIGSDAGNIPHVMGGLGTIFPCGDVDALVRAIAGYAEEIASAERDDRDPVLPTTSGLHGLTEWRALVRRHLEDYSAEAYEANFLRLLARVLGDSPGGPPPWLVDASRSALPSSSVTEDDILDQFALTVPVR